MKNPENQRYLKMGVTGVATAAVCLLMTYTIFNMGNVIKLFSSIGDILMPFLFGGIIAYLLAPLCNKIEHLICRLAHKDVVSSAVRLASIAIALVLALAAVVTLIVLVIPQVASSAILVISTLPDKLAAFFAMTAQMLEPWDALADAWNSTTVFVMDQVNAIYNGDFFAMAKAILDNGVGSKVVGVFDVVSDLFFGILISVYMLASRRRFASQAKLILHSAAPVKWADIIEGEVHFADKMFNGFLVGKVLDSVIIGALCFAGCLALQIDNAAFISVLVLVFNIVPFFGPIAAAIVCGILLLIQDPIEFLYFEIFFLVLQQFDGNILGPRIIGNATGLSGFWVLFAILLFGGLWGVPGMIVGIPLLSVIYDIVRRLVRWGLNRKGKGELLESYWENFPASSASSEDFVQIAEVEETGKIAAASAEKDR